MSRLTVTSRAIHCATRAAQPINRRTARDRTLVASATRNSRAIGTTDMATSIWRLALGRRGVSTNEIRPRLALGKRILLICRIIEVYGRTHGAEHRYIP